MAPRSTMWFGSTSLMASVMVSAKFRSAEAAAVAVHEPSRLRASGSLASWYHGILLVRQWLRGRLRQKVAGLPPGQVFFAVAVTALAPVVGQRGHDPEAVL